MFGHHDAANRRCGQTWTLVIISIRQFRLVAESKAKRSSPDVTGPGLSLDTKNGSIAALLSIILALHPMRLSGRSLGKFNPYRRVGTGNEKKERRQPITLTSRSLLAEFLSEIASIAQSPQSEAETLLQVPIDLGKPSEDTSTMMLSNME